MTGWTYCGFCMSELLICSRFVGEREASEACHSPKSQKVDKTSILVFKVIQCHCFCYQSKARVRLSIPNHILNLALSRTVSEIHSGVAKNLQLGGSYVFLLFPVLPLCPCPSCHPHFTLPFPFPVLPSFSFLPSLSSRTP